MQFNNRYYPASIGIACNQLKCNHEKIYKIIDKQLSTINYNFKKRFQRWLLELTLSEKLPETISALNFALFKIDYNEYAVYMIASNKFSSKNSDWARDEDYEPKLKYFSVKQKSISKLDNAQFMNLIVKTLKKELSSKKLKNTFFDKIKHITTGFDGGDLITIK